MSNRTQHAVTRFLAALDAPSYDIGIRHPLYGMMPRTFTCAQLGESIPWLRYQNAQSSDIYIRPTHSRGLVMLDDLDHEAITLLRHDGLDPCAVVETSRDNFQVWIRLIHNREARDLEPSLIRRVLLAPCHTL